MDTPVLTSLKRAGVWLMAVAALLSPLMAMPVTRSGAGFFSYTVCFSLSALLWMFLQWWRHRIGDAWDAALEDRPVVLRRLERLRHVLIVMALACMTIGLVFFFVYRRGQIAWGPVIQAPGFMLMTWGNALLAYIQARRNKRDRSSLSLQQG